MSNLETRINRALDSALAERRIVGAVFVVAQRGEVIFHRAVGLADREAGRSMEETTPFRLASLTKPVTAVTALALIERGELALDDLVTRWLPDFRPRFGTETPSITVEHLLTHTSGLGYGFLELPGGPYHLANVSDGFDQPGLSLDENLERLASIPLLALPGSAWHYSLSFDVLGGVIERVAGAPLSEVVARHVTGPLGLDLSFSPPDGVAANYADGVPFLTPPPPGPRPAPWRIEDRGSDVPYGPFTTRFVPPRAADPASFPSGGCGLHGTAASYLRFVEALRTKHLPTVSEARLEAMMTDQVPHLSSDILGAGWGYGFGLGVLRDPAAAQVPLHVGALDWAGAYGNRFWIDRAKGTTCVLLTNTAFEGMAGQIRTDLIEAVHA